jgi:hypothetical protein
MPFRRLLCACVGASVGVVSFLQCLYSINNEGGYSKGRVFVLKMRDSVSTRVSRQWSNNVGSPLYCGWKDKALQRIHVVEGLFLRVLCCGERMCAYFTFDRS